MNYTLDNERDIFIFRDRLEMVKALGRQWSRAAEKALKEREVFVVALSAGEILAEAYHHLANFPDVLPWEKTHIFLADERFVALDHMDGNYHMIRENLLKTVPIPEENVHMVPVDLETTDAAADAYEKELGRFFRLAPGTFPVFDMIILGVGVDGHTASLFPGNRALDEKSRLAVATYSSMARHERISLTLPVINNAREIIFLVSGQRKSVVLRKILRDNALLPAGLARAEHGRVGFFIDKEAAADLSEAAEN